MPDLIFGLIFWVALGLSIVYAPWAELARLRRENAVLRDKVRALMTRVFELIDGQPE